MLFSHPNKELKDHLINTAENSRRIINELKLELGINEEIIIDIAVIIALSHDLGKSTKFFQKYLFADDNKRLALKAKKETNHSLFSAITAYFFTKEYVKDKALDGFADYLPLISFIVVKRHHGNLKDFLSEFADYNDEIFKNQINGIDKGDCEKLFLDINEAFPNAKINFSNFLDNKEKILEEIKELPLEVAMDIGNFEDIRYFIITQLLYSVLLESDKKDVILDNQIIGREDVDSNLIDNFKEIKYSSAKEKINLLRNAIYKEAIGNIKNIDIYKNRIFSLAVPTGTGKTFTSVSFALKLRKIIEEKLNFKPRIVYSLPFLSIIDQNSDGIRNIFEVVNKKEPTSTLLLKHHHLSEISYKIYGGEGNDYENIDLGVDESEFLIEGWNSEIIITTFIQFFYSIINNKNRMLRKFHNICNSIIILDEVQTIPHKYWLIISEVCKALTAYCNCFFIFVTATMPLIFDKDDLFALVKPEQYFKDLDRITLKIDQNKIKLDEFKEWIKSYIENSDKNSFMVVMNTIKSSIDVFKHLKIFEKNGFKFFYLSSNIYPKQRLDVIKKIKEPGKKIIVTTQVIEAGVDIDVDVIFRDLAPLDSINQVCGRCNRNNEKGKGEVFIFNVTDEKRNKQFYSYIYDGFLIERLKETIGNKDKFDESEFLDLITKYYTCLKNKKSDDASSDILKNIYDLNFSKFEEFRLIEEQQPQIDVFVDIGEAQHQIWEKFKALEKLKPLDRKKKFLEIKKEFNEYLISVDVKDITALGLPTDKQIMKIDDQYYDGETGFRKDLINDYGVFI